MNTLELENDIGTFTATKSDWVQLNKFRKCDTVEYCGNYFLADSTDVYAVFYFDNNLYAVKID